MGSSISKEQLFLIDNSEMASYHKRRVSDGHFTSKETNEYLTMSEIEGETIKPYVMERIRKLTECKTVYVLHIADAFLASEILNTRHPRNCRYIVTVMTDEGYFYIVRLIRRDSGQVEMKGSIEAYKNREGALIVSHQLFLNATS